MKEKFLRAIPIYKKEQLDLISVKDDGSAFVTLKEFRSVGKIILNKTALEIYKMCNGKNSIDDIVNCIYKEYIDSVSEKKIIENDVNEILKNFLDWNIIEFEDNPFKTHYERYFDEFNIIKGKICRASEISDIIEAYDCIRNDVVFNRKYYLKTSHLNEACIHGVCIVSEFLIDEKSKLIVEIRRENSLGLSLIMNVMYMEDFDYKIFKNEIIKFLKWSVMNINNKSSAYYANKLIIRIKQNFDDEIRNMLSVIGFKNIGVEKDILCIGKEAFSIENWQLLFDL